MCMCLCLCVSVSVACRCVSVCVFVSVSLSLVSVSVSLSLVSGSVSLSLVSVSVFLSPLPGSVSVRRRPSRADTRRVLVAVSVSVCRQRYRQEMRVLVAGSVSVCRQRSRPSTPSATLCIRRCVCVCQTLCIRRGGCARRYASGGVCVLVCAQYPTDGTRQKGGPSHPAGSAGSRCGVSESRSAPKRVQGASGGSDKGGSCRQSLRRPADAVILAAG